MFDFTLLSSHGHARRGQFTTPHGVIETPVFMNVATQAAIKGGLSSSDLETVDCQVALCNTYHLHVRPGEEIVKDLGGLHGFMNWDHPILTDSGGFQVFSLASPRSISEEGVAFASHVDGRKIFLRPENSVQIQHALGADIIMAFDECIQNPAPYDYVRRSCERTMRWLARCTETHESHKDKQALFGINQGGVYADLRVEHAKRIVEFDLPGYAVGGLAVGETHEEMYHILDTVLPHLPIHKPRYLMGVGTPGNILQAVARGVDFFDWVLPARNARHAHVYTSIGRLNLKNEKYTRDDRPIDEACSCPTCRRHSRAYIRHLFKAGELLALRLSVTHNLFFYNQLMRDIRNHIQEKTFDQYRRQKADLLDAPA